MILLFPQWLSVLIVTASWHLVPTKWEVQHCTSGAHYISAKSVNAKWCAMETSLQKNMWVAGLIHRFILEKFRLNKWPNDKSASTCCKPVKSNGGWTSSRLLVYLSTSPLLSTGQAVDNNAPCLSGQRSRDPVIRIHPIWPFLSCRVLFVDT